MLINLFCHRLPARNAHKSMCVKQYAQSTGPMSRDLDFCSEFIVVTVWPCVFTGVQSWQEASSGSTLPGDSQRRGERFTHQTEHSLVFYRDI